MGVGQKKAAGQQGKKSSGAKKGRFMNLICQGRYYSFDVKNWHFIVLDSLMRDQHRYMAKLNR